MKILHIITGLKTGGAESTLLRIVTAMHPRHESIVISLMDGGEIGAKIEQAGIRVLTLGMKPGVPDASSFRKLVNWVKEIQPDLVQTWMYHADLIGGLASRRAGIKTLVWNIRHTNLDTNANKRTTLLTAKLCALLSRKLPRRIISCSEAARERHIRFGYSGLQMVVIPNGYDVSLYHPDPEAGKSVRQELGLPEAAPLIGIVGRFHPQKDHATFVKAAGILARTHPGVRFLLCGDGIEESNSQLTEWIQQAGIKSTVSLLGRRSDIPRLDAALDVAAISSVGEGFPNVVGEAMACGVPCVVTDVGDAAYLVGETGIVVPPRSPEALAAGWAELLALSPEARRAKGLLARERVLEKFTLEKIVLQYEQLYRELI